MERAHAVGAILQDQRKRRTKDGMMIKVFANGHGGKHRAGDPEAARWRALSTHTAIAIRAAHPQMTERFVREHAELETEHVTHALNRRNKIEMGW